MPVAKLILTVFVAATLIRGFRTGLVKVITVDVSGRGTSFQFGLHLGVVGSDVFSEADVASLVWLSLQVWTVILTAYEHQHQE